MAYLRLAQLSLIICLSYNPTVWHKASCVVWESQGVCLLNVLGRFMSSFWSEWCPEAILSVVSFVKGEMSILCWIYRVAYVFFFFLLEEDTSFCFTRFLTFILHFAWNCRVREQAQMNSRLLSIFSLTRFICTNVDYWIA